MLDGFWVCNGVLDFISPHLDSVYLLLYAYLIPGVVLVMSFLTGVFFSVVNILVGIT